MEKLLQKNQWKMFFPVSMLVMLVSFFSACNSNGSRYSADVADSTDVSEPSQTLGGNVVNGNQDSDYEEW